MPYLRYKLGDRATIEHPDIYLWANRLAAVFALSNSLTS